MAVTVREHEKTPLWRNAAFLKWSSQLLALVVTLGFFVILGRQAFANFSASGTTFDLDFLTDPIGVFIREGIDTEPDSSIRALAVGAMNTLRVSITGIIAATIIGTLIGIGRLSHNWIVNKIATFYIETIRNIPLLVQIFFWQAMVIALPSLVAADIGEYWFKASNKGFGFAWVSWNGGFWPWLVFVGAGIVAGGFVSRWRHRVQEETGKSSHAGYFALGTLIVFAIVGWFAWPLLSFIEPILHGIASFVDGVPAIVVPIVIALAALLGAAWWIRNFFESRRTPAGFGKLTDDDWFRVIFVGVMGVIVTVIAFLVSGITVTTVAGEVLTIAELIRSGIGNFFDWLGNSFAADGGQPLNFSKASVVQKGNFAQFGDTGAVMTVPFFAVWFAVTLYTAAFIAEIVRGGILAVSKGQTEAAEAVGLKRSQFLRLIILPQAFRIILPPIGNQYLNLFKNTSLGIGVAYAEIVSVGSTILNQTGQTLPIVLIWMAFFLTGSLMISGVVNYYNRKMKLVER
jgi:general L-amino acid transport system permease protein